MPKKRKAGKPQRKAVVTGAAKTPAPVAPAELAEINRKLALILRQQESLVAMQKKLSREEEQIEQEEERIEAVAEAEEQKLEHVTEKEMTELEQLKALEERIQKEVKTHPLRKITFRDFTKGMIGAFVGIVAHFSFLEGQHFAETFTLFRATLMYVTSFIIGMAFLYFAGFRSVGDRFVLKFIPLRIFVIYLTAILVIVVVLWLFGVITAATHFEEIYKTVSAISILAILGACTADLIGKEH